MISAVMKSLVFLYCFSIILAVHPAAASTTTPAAQEVQQDAWVYYATDEDGTAYAYSPGLMERLQGNIIKVWVKALYSEKNQKYNEGQFEWEINCSKKTMRGISANIIKKNGTSEAISKSSDWSPIPAESTAETLFELTCKKEKQDKKK